jgi:hypothetical protein
MIVFKQFLKDNNVDFDLFELNRSTKQYRNWKGVMDWQSQKDNPTSWIRDAFLWEKSLQQDINWDGLNYKWRDILVHNETEIIVYTHSFKPEW